MSLRLFIDQCVPKSIIQILRDTEHEVFVWGDYINSGYTPYDKEETAVPCPYRQ